jgi:hypothetical protein
LERDRYEEHGKLKDKQIKKKRNLKKDVDRISSIKELSAISEWWEETERKKVPRTILKSSHTGVKSLMAWHCHSIFINIHFPVPKNSIRMNGGRWDRFGQTVKIEWYHSSHLFWPKKKKKKANKKNFWGHWWGVSSPNMIIEMCFFCGKTKQKLKNSPTHEELGFYPEEDKKKNTLEEER